MKAGLFDALEDSVELGVAHVEGIVVTVKRGVLVEQERQRSAGAIVVIATAVIDERPCLSVHEF